MPPTRTPVKASRAGARAATRTPPAPPSRFSRVLSRFRAAGQRSSAAQRSGASGSFFRDVRGELRKVEWPSREEGTKLTAAVIGLSAIVGIFLGSVDFIFQELFRFLISLSNGGY
jgi:preprotein translocase subunit SecE